MNKTKYVAFRVISFFCLGSCATVYSFAQFSAVGFGTGLEKEWGTGGRIGSHFFSYSEQNVMQVANEFCSVRNLSKPTITLISSPSFFGSEYYNFEFQCDKKIASDTSYPKDNNQPSRIDKISLNEAKDKCVKLGFSENTEEFGKCVLQLSK